MKTRIPATKALTLIALSSLALLSMSPTAAADSGPTATTFAACGTEPLGTPGGGVVGDVQRLGNTVIYNGCVFVLDVAGAVLVLAINGVNLVCNFAVGHPCLTGELFDQ
jgi:hypothetical protein